MTFDTHAKLVHVNTLKGSIRQEMLDLMQKYYDGVTKEDFHSDLNDKSHCILIFNDKSIVGFSTLRTLRSSHLPNSICVYSGDTIVDSQYWGQQQLVGLWCKYIVRVQVAYPNLNVYWLLTSKGIKTYRFLPLYFNEYYPRQEEGSLSNLESLKIHLDTYAGKIYRDTYDRETNLIHHIESSQRLKNTPILSELHSCHKKGVSFFYSKNPRWNEGVELASLVHVHDNNLTRAGRRAFARLKAEEYIKSA